MEKQLKPAIRFKGFTDPWEQRKFEDIAVRSSAISSESGLPRVEYEDIRQQMTSISRFFLGDWFCTLSGADNGSAILRMLDSEVL